MKGLVKKIILMAVLFTAINSCKNFSDLVFNQNKDFKHNKLFYLEKFESSALAPQKVYFVDSNNLNSLKSKYTFLKSINSNEFYYYYGTFYMKEELLMFKSLDSTKTGCKDVLESLKNKKSHPYSIIDSNENLIFDNYSFFNIKSEPLEIKEELEMVFLIYNHSMGNIFFNDTIELISFIESNPNYDYVVLFSDIFSQ